MTKARDFFRQSIHWLGLHCRYPQLLADALSAGHWSEKKMRASELERMFGFVKSPQLRAQHIT